ncbi:MAG: hypothetical protein H7A23_18610 [Leptospiraceae bacterium]|nr:hypothetical protein [Leptospiraceae bacterium]
MAILLVLLGVFCFIYVFFKQQGEERNPRKAGKGNSKKRYEHDNQYTLFNLRYPEYKESSEYEAKIRMERSLGKKWVNISQESITEIHNTIVEEKVIPYSTITNDMEVEKETVEEPNTHITVLDVGFSISGILFLDYGKKIPYENKKFKDIDLMEDNFLSFKRIGPATMEEREGSFSFVVNGSQLHEYHVHSLDQIVFLEGAFSFIPTDEELPVPVFFTDEIDKFKRFLAGR